LKKIVKDYLVLALIAGPIVVLDQWSKAFVRTSLPMGAIWSPWEWLTPYARIVHWQNTGVAFGMFQGQSTVFAILAVIVSAIIIYYYPRIAREDWILRLALGLQLAGALGNLVDRVTVGHVTDFISVGSFAVFNVADASISVGVVVLLISVWLQERRDKQNAARPELEPVEETPAREE
jgi:signal peptidase II